MEDRLTPSTITGTGNAIAVDGVASLREAITATNSKAASGEAPADGPVAATRDVMLSSDPADVSFTMVASPDPAPAGGLVTYTIVVANAGPDSAQDLELINVIPTHTTFFSFAAPDGWTAILPPVGGGDTGGGGNTVVATAASLASGASATFTLQLRVNPGSVAGTTINNVASISATNDPNHSNNSASTIVTVSTPTPPVELSADLAVTLTSSPPPHLVGFNFLYTIQIFNNGPDPASSVVMTDVLPEGVTFVSITSGLGLGTYDPATRTITVNITDLSVGAGPTLHITVHADSVGTFTSVAHIQGAQTDPDPANNTASRTDVVVFPAPPQVAYVRRNGVHAMPTSLVVTFNTAMDPVPAQDVGNYQIRASGRRIQVESAVYDASTRSVTLRPVRRINIHHPFLLVINAQPPNGLTDRYGTPLDGAGNWQAGTDYVARVVWYGADTRVTPVHPKPVRTSLRAPLLSRPATRFAGALHNTQIDLLARAWRQASNLHQFGF